VTYLVTDTHPFLWYTAENFSKLSPSVKKAFDDAVEGRIAIWVPVVVLWELSLLIKAGKIQTSRKIQDYISNNFFAKAIHPLDMTPLDVAISEDLNFTKDPYDTLIVAMALRMDCALITNDSVIHTTQPCQLFW
jgi:PIN domain nuclease of toxin-antitoxin system